MARALANARRLVEHSVHDKYAVNADQRNEDTIAGVYVPVILRLGASPFRRLRGFCSFAFAYIRASRCRAVSWDRCWP